MKKTKTKENEILKTVLAYTVIVLLSALSSTIVFTLFKYTPTGIVNTINSYSYKEGYRTAEKNFGDSLLDFADRCYDAKIKNIKTDWNYLVFSKQYSSFSQNTSVILSCEDVLRNYQPGGLTMGPARSNDWVSVMKNK